MNIYTVSHTPQQNGIAERRNRYLLDPTRCLLIESGMSKGYWAEAVMTANYLQNRVSTRATKLTPYERWHGEKSSLNNVHIFGATVYAKIPDEKRNKLDDKSTKLTFIGYDETVKGLKLIDTLTKKVVFKIKTMIMFHKIQMNINLTLQLSFLLIQYQIKLTY